MKKDTKEIVNKTNSSFFERALIRLYLMSKKMSVIFLVSTTLVFLTGISLVIAGTAIARTIELIGTNPYFISGVTIMIISLITVCLTAPLSNYGGKLLEKKQQNHIESYAEKIQNK